MLTKFSQIIPASGELVAGNDNNALVFLSSTAAVNLRIENSGAAERFDSVSGGIYIRRIRPWSQCRFLGAAGTTVEFFVGTEINDKDETDIRLAVTQIAGSVSVIDAPTTVLTDTAPVVAADAAQTPLVAASLTRRKVSFTIDSTAGGVLYLRSTAGANNLAELQPGIMYPFASRAGFDIRNDTGAAVNVYVLEET